jgi:hypothetical protein
MDYLQASVMVMRRGRVRGRGARREVLPRKDRGDIVRGNG